MKTRSLALRPALITGAVLLVPLVMNFVDRRKAVGEGWHWGPADFAVMGALIFVAAIAYEFFARKLGSGPRRAAFAVLVLALAGLVWVELAVDGLSQLIGFLSGSSA